jgi:DNA-binding CsgD family transcriptional regulator
LKLTCQEYTNHEIASILNVSAKAIEANKTNLYQKIGCKNIAGLVAYAYKNQYVIN